MLKLITELNEEMLVEVHEIVQVSNKKVTLINEEFVTVKNDNKGLIKSILKEIRGDVPFKLIGSHLFIKRFKEVK